AAQLLELFVRKRRLAQYLGHQLERLRKALADGFERAPVSADADVRLEPVESVAELLAGVLARAAQQHPAREAAGRRAVQLAVLVAPSQSELRHHGAAARFLGEQRELHSAGERPADDARLDVRGGRVEILALRHRGRAAVVLERGGEI